ncbi:MAG: hypothetical protein GC181_06080 [Bacteroidetes bacterium]|nr:hypothetical protein [Bacteroidota bacterium]
MKKIISALLLGVFMFAGQAFSQEKENRELGINIRSLWLGGSLHMLYRVQKKENAWRRIDLMVSPNFHQTAFDGKIGETTVPLDFRSNINNNLNLTYRNVKEKYHRLAEGFDFYHGLMFYANYNYSESTSLFGGSTSIFYNSHVVQNVNLGLGYLAGLRYKFSDRFALGFDTDLVLSLGAGLVNDELQTYTVATNLINTTYPKLDELSKSIDMQQTGTRIWLLFSFNK